MMGIVTLTTVTKTVCLQLRKFKLISALREGR